MSEVRFHFLSVSAMTFQRTEIKKIYKLDGENKYQMVTLESSIDYYVFWAGLFVDHYSI